MSQLSYNDVIKFTVEELKSYIDDNSKIKSLFIELSEMILRRYKYLTTDDKITKEDVNDMTLLELKEITTTPELIDKIPLEVLQYISLRYQTIGSVKPKSGTKSKYAIISHTNMRYKALMNMQSVGMVAFLYKMWREKSNQSNVDPVGIKLNNFESEAVKKFLDGVFQYDPSDSIDRYSNEIYSKAEREFTKSKDESYITNVNIPHPITKVMRDIQGVSIKSDSTESRSKDKNPKKQYISKDKLSASSLNTDGSTTSFDIPSNYLASFMNYMTTNYDAIHYIAENLYIYNDVGDNKDEYKSITETVEIKGITYDGEVKNISTKTFTTPAVVWEDTFCVHGKLFDTEDGAKQELDILKNKYPQVWTIINTDNTVLTADWRINRNKTRIDDPHLAKIFTKLDDDLKLGQDMKFRALRKAKLQNIIENGPEAEDFKKYIADTNPEFGKDWKEEDMDRIMVIYRKWMNEKNIHEDTNLDFVHWYRALKPNRNFDAQPLNHKERVEFSIKYNNENIMPELPQDIESMGVDVFIQDGAELKQDRMYIEGFETVKGKSFA